MNTPLNFEQKHYLYDFAFKDIAIYDFSNISDFSCSNGCDTVIAVIRKEQANRLQKEAKKHNGTTYFVISRATHKNGSDFELLSVAERINKMFPKSIKIISNDKGFDDFVSMQNRMGNRKFSRVGKVYETDFDRIVRYVRQANNRKVRITKKNLKLWMDKHNVKSSQIRGMGYSILKEQVV